KQKTAYDIFTRLEFRRALFRSRSMAEAEAAEVSNHVERATALVASLNASGPDTETLETLDAVASMLTEQPGENPAADPGSDNPNQGPGNNSGNDNPNQGPGNNSGHDHPNPGPGDNSAHDNPSPGPGDDPAGGNPSPAPGDNPPDDDRGPGGGD